MTTINVTKGELVEIANGCFSVLNLKGKEFGLTVSKNIEIIKEALKDVEEAGKPSPEFVALAEQVNDLANLDSEDSKVKIAKLEEDNQELVDSRRTQLDQVRAMMADDISIELHTLSETILPEDITASQISALSKITMKS